MGPWFSVNQQVGIFQIPGCQMKVGDIISPHLSLLIGWVVWSMVIMPCQSWVQATKKAKNLGPLIFDLKKIFKSQENFGKWPYLVCAVVNENRLNDLSRRNDDLSDKISSANSRIDSLSNTIGSQAITIYALQTEVNTLKAKTAGKIKSGSFWIGWANAGVLNL